MKYITESLTFNQGKITNIKVIKNDTLKNIEIKDSRFLLIILTDGNLKFKRGDAVINAAAPCFICFNEQENPVLISKHKAKYHCVYFHPDFLNINMSFDFIRSKTYEDIAYNHDMFMLKPFLDNSFVIPIFEGFTDKIETACIFMNEELTTQRDWYWSCRGRSYFMEIIIALERMYGLLCYGKADKNTDVSFILKNPKLRNAVLFIESNYMNDINLKDICKAANINHTTLTRLIKEEIGMTALEYLYFYRITVAKKQLEFTDVPIKDITLRTGFKTVQHFNRTFTRLIGETPASFRKNAVKKRKDEIK